MLVVEAVNKDPNYLYGKRVWYLDPESYYILWSEMYDAQGRFWKCFMNATSPLKTEIGDVKPVIVGTYFLNFQRQHSGQSDYLRIKPPKISMPLNPSMFTLTNLQKTY